jgi:hypothetical protein
MSHSGTGGANVSTALVPIAAAECGAPATYENCRPNADFLAQLIAMAGKAPQARRRRRVEPQEAIAAYRARGAMMTLSGRALSRSL